MPSVFSVSFWRVIILRILQNLNARLTSVLNRDVDLVGTRTRDVKVEDAVRYIFTCFHDYLTQGGLPAEDLEGRNILELGPGDNVGVALLFVAHGAKVTTLDRFTICRDSAHEKEIYDALASRLDDPVRSRLLARILWNEKGIEPSKWLTQISNRAIEDPDGDGVLDDSFDWILSRAVLQYVHRLPDALRHMHSRLKQNGRMIHKVDFRDDGLFTAHGYHPLSRLALPDGLYQAMTCWTFRPTRNMLHDLQTAFQRLFDPVEIQITDMLDGSSFNTPVQWNGLPENCKSRSLHSVDEVFDQLHPRFKQHSREDLAVTGAFFVVQNKK